MNTYFLRLDQNRYTRFFFKGLPLVFLLSACSPKYDWREIQSNEAPYVIAFPAKPSQQTRTIQLEGQSIAMTMSSTLVDGLTFAVTSAKMADPAKAQAALPVLKKALINNVQGAVKQESKLKLRVGEGEQVELAGSQNRQGRTRQIGVRARFVRHGAYIYQLVVTGPQEKLVATTLDTFFTSFVSRE
jgi:hypothetical protein